MTSPTINFRTFAAVCKPFQANPESIFELNACISENHSQLTEYLLQQDKNK